MSLINELRRKIDEEHARAIEALEVLAQYIDPGKQTGRDMVTRLMGDAAKRKPNRHLVLNEIAGKWATVKEIVSATQLDPKQVRGVLYAPALQNEIERRESVQGQQYRYQQNGSD